MSSDSKQVRSIIPGGKYFSRKNFKVLHVLTYLTGPEPQSNIPDTPNALTSNPDGVPTFVHGQIVDSDPFAAPTTAEDTMTGATSADVHNGLGHPGSGQTSTETRHDGMHGRKKHGPGEGQWGEVHQQDEQKERDDSRDI